MNLKLAAVASVVLFSACEAGPINREAIHTGNVDVTVAVIAQVDGFNVYRLRDGAAGEAVYFIAPSHGPLQTAWTTCVGKNCTPVLHTVLTMLERAK